MNKHHVLKQLVLLFSCLTFNMQLLPAAPCTDDASKQSKVEAYLPALLHGSEAKDIEKVLRKYIHPQHLNLAHAGNLVGQYRFLYQNHIPNKRVTALMLTTGLFYKEIDIKNLNRDALQQVWGWNTAYLAVRKHYSVDKHPSRYSHHQATDFADKQSGKSLQELGANGFYYSAQELPDCYKDWLSDANITLPDVKKSVLMEPVKK